MIEEYQLTIIKIGIQECWPLNKIAKTAKIDKRTVKKYKILIENGNIITLKKEQKFTYADLYLKKNNIKDLYFKYEENCVVLCRELPLELGISAPLRTLQRFCKEFREDARKTRNTIRGRVETKAGDQMQIDFGERDVKIAGEMVRVHIFVAILCYSRRIFAKAYYTENGDAWLDGIESSFYYFGGVPRNIVSDNTRCLLIKFFGPTELRFRESYLNLCNYYGTKPIATKPRSPQSKGKVEKAVHFVKHNALPGKSFESIEELNIYLEHWSLTVADHITINNEFIDEGKTPHERWNKEKEHLLPLIKRPRLIRMRIEYRIIDKNGLLRVDNVYYRIPGEFCGDKVQVVICKDTISVKGPGNKQYNIDKANDKFMPKQQPMSSSETPQQETYNTMMTSLQQDENWQRLQKPAIQRDCSEYDFCERQGE